MSSHRFPHRPLVLVVFAFAVTLLSAGCEPMCDYCESFTEFAVQLEDGAAPDGYRGSITTSGVETAIECPRDIALTSAPRHGDYFCEGTRLQLFLLAESVEVDLVSADESLFLEASVAIDIDRASGSCACDHGSARLVLGEARGTVP